MCKGKIEELEKRSESVTEREKQLKEELAMLKAENEKLKTELTSISEQMKKISKMYQEVSKEKEEVTNIKDLLAIYVTLLEDVFYGRPHARILWILNKTKSEMKRSELNNTLGFQAAVIKKAIFDLKNAGLVDYNEDQDIVKLKKKILA